MKHNDLQILRAILRPSCPSCRLRLQSKPRFQQRRHASTRTSPSRPKSADDPDFISIADQPPQLISTKKKHTALGILTLALIPFTALCLGTWQVYRLEWKTQLIAKFEDRLVRPPLPLPPRLDPSAIAEFDYRRVYATGTFRHDLEMLIGPRIHDGTDGFLVVTPFERGEGASTILVNRGWIPREKQFQRDRDASALPKGEVTIAGLLREPFLKNFFTPKNKPEQGKFYFPDVYEMAQVSGADPVWIEETMQPSLLASYDRESKGVPIGRIAEVNLRNNHLQYIFTWYSLSAATAIMMWMVLKKKPADLARRVRRSTEW